MSTIISKIAYRGVESYTKMYKGSTLMYEVGEPPVVDIPYLCLESATSEPITYKATGSYRMLEYPESYEYSTNLTTWNTIASLKHTVTEELHIDIDAIKEGTGKIVFKIPYAYTQAAGTYAYDQYDVYVANNKTVSQSTYYSKMQKAYTDSDGSVYYFLQIDMSYFPTDTSRVYINISNSTSCKSGTAATMAAIRDNGNMLWIKSATSATSWTFGGAVMDTEFYVTSTTEYYDDVTAKKIYFRGSKNNYFSNSQKRNVSQWSITGDFKVSGDFRTLQDYNNYDTITSMASEVKDESGTTIATYSGYGLYKEFYGLTNIVGLNLNFEWIDEMLTMDLREMFCNCSNVDGTIVLPDTVASYGYYQTFSGCSSLTTAPELPATTLDANCYGNMFGGCSSLVDAPELPATTLAANCYASMFSGCSSLVNAPALPATTIATYCYAYMFYNCSSLVNAPALPATTLETYCYRNMFYGCSSLVTAPELPATTLTTYCYNEMFYNCSSLSDVSFGGNMLGVNTTSWLYGVPSTGMFHNFGGAGYKEGASGIPTGWTVVETKRAGIPDGFTDWFCIEVENGDTIDLQFANAEENNLRYSTDGSKPYNSVENGTLYTLNEGAKIYLLADTVYINKSNITISASAPDNNTTIKCSGEISTMYGDSGYIPVNSGLRNLFNSAWNDKYTIDFTDCKFPRTCSNFLYHSMFAGNKSNITGITFRSTKMSESACGFMFYGCTSLVNPPVTSLPATTLYSGCYYQMFYGCTSLVTAPKILATTMANSSCYRMFNRCSSLSDIEYHADTISSDYNGYWVEGVSSTGTFHNCGGATVSYGSSAIPEGWTVVTTPRE